MRILVEDLVMKDLVFRILLRRILFVGSCYEDLGWRMWLHKIKVITKKNT